MVTTIVEILENAPWKQGSPPQELRSKIESAENQIRQHDLNGEVEEAARLRLEIAGYLWTLEDQYSGTNKHRAVKQAALEWSRNHLGRVPQRYFENSGDGPVSQTREAGTDDEMDVDLDVTEEIPDVSLSEDIVGLSEFKRTADAELALFDPKTRAMVRRLYGDAVATSGGSILLYGPPGSGKSTVVKALVHEVSRHSERFDGEVVYMTASGKDILSKHPGAAERRVAAIFEQARSVAEDGGFVVLFFDEVESLVSDRTEADKKHQESLTNAFLDAIETDDHPERLLTIAATNHPFNLDAAGARRFTSKQLIVPPGPEGMAALWESELSSLVAGDAACTVDYDRLGRLSAEAGFTPAEIVDEILGKSLQRELVESVVTDGTPVEPDTEFFENRLNAARPRTLRQYVTDVYKAGGTELQKYPRLQEFVEEQAAKFGIGYDEESTGSPADARSGLFGAGGEVAGLTLQSPNAEAEELSTSTESLNSRGSTSGRTD